MSKLSENPVQIKNLNELDQILKFISKSPRNYSTLGEIDQEKHMGGTQGEIHVFNRTDNDSTIKNLEFLLTDGYIKFEQSRYKGDNDKYYLTKKGQLKLNGTSFVQEYKNNIKLTNLEIDNNTSSIFRNYGSIILSFVAILLSAGKILWDIFI